MMELSPVSKLAIELCQELGVPYSFGKGYATLDGIPLNQLDEESLFNYAIQTSVDVIQSCNKQISYLSDKSNTPSKENHYTIQYNFPSMFTESSSVIYKADLNDSPTAA